MLTLKLRLLQPKVLWLVYFIHQESWKPSPGVRQPISIALQKENSRLSLSLLKIFFIYLLTHYQMFQFSKLKCRGSWPESVTFHNYPCALQGLGMRFYYWNPHPYQTVIRSLKNNKNCSRRTNFLLKRSLNVCFSFVKN